MKDNWGITVKEYKTDIYKQIYVGWKIYQIQLKKSKGNIKKAHTRYSGGHKGYHNKVMKENFILKQKVEKTI